MPIPLTKYNKISALHNDISNNSYIYNTYILTCDISDTQYLDNGIQKNKNIYLNNKANYLIHPFSNVTNCTTKFNNEKSLYQYKKPLVPPINGITDYDISATQKIIQKTVRVPSSLYSNNLASLHINSNNLGTNKPWNNASDRVVAHGPNSNQNISSIKQNYGVDIKHNSYDRYLGRKKSQHLKSDTEVTIPSPYTTWPTYWGNKTYKFSIVNCKKTC
tara:strand:- start:826 stop:1479 length:654 start_codon:yes stop_codon:yes gene_type:complete